MTAQPALHFRPLTPEELDLTEGLAALAAPNAPETESFGIGENGTPPSAGAAWGLFIGDALAGAAWFDAQPNGKARILAVALPRRRWNMGLTTFMIGELAKTVAGGELSVTVTAGGKALGEALEDAGMSGPDPEAENYPLGEWTRTA